MGLAYSKGIKQSTKARYEAHLRRFNVLQLRHIKTSSKCGIFFWSNKEFEKCKTLVLGNLKRLYFPNTRTTFCKNI